MDSSQGVSGLEAGGGNLDVKEKKGGPLMGAIWFFLLFIIFGIVWGLADFDVLYIFIGWRSMIAFAGYLVMQIGLWYTENKWDEEGSVAFLEAAGQDPGQTPEELEAKSMEATIPEDKLKAAFPTPWGFLIGWWLWGLSYLFPMDGSSDVDPTPFGIIALVVSILVSIIASVPMADAVQNRKAQQKNMLSLAFVIGWFTLGAMSALDASKIIDDDLGSGDKPSKAGTWLCCMLGPVTIIMSQKILFGSRKMGTEWEASGKPNFHPIVYNMGGPLFVLGWFLLWLGTSGVPAKYTAIPGEYLLYPKLHDLNDDLSSVYIPLFLNWRTWLSFMGGCAMVPVVRFLDYSHDEDGPWCGENDETPKRVFGKWWLGTDGTYFGLFLESPWPFVISWMCFGFSSWIMYDDKVEPGIREIILFVNCLAQGVDAGILIQANLYAGNMAGKQKFSMPFVALFVALAVNIGSRWSWRALIFSLPGAILIILGQKTVFGARKRGDYTMQNNGKANPYNQVYVYSWGEVFFMMGWILICWGMSFPTSPKVPSIPNFG